MGWAPALWAYRTATRIGTGRGERVLARRAAAGKEDTARLGERRGVAGLPRPQGRLVWFHAASVGESLALLELIRRLLATVPDLHCLMTTGTVTSAGMMAARMPERCHHQFVPLDLRPWVRRFLDHWRPDLAVWTESELWPNLLLETRARGTPMLLLNARLSERSAKRWRFLPGAARHLLGSFDTILAQDAATAGRLRTLGAESARVRVAGTLKEGTPALPCDETERARLTAQLAERPVWCAASTHPGEEDIALRAHLLAARTVLRLLMVMVPRHPERGAELAAMLRAQGVSVARRAADEPVRPDTQVLLADTMGELGLWYRLAPVSFVGGSLVPVGGHNPFEPAALGSAILYGPHVENFSDIFARLAAADAAWPVQDAESLAAALVTLAQPDRRAPMALAAWEVCSAGAGATDRALDALVGLLPDPA